MVGVVAHYRDGGVVRGYTTDFSANSSFFHLINPDNLSQKERVNLEDLKAVFFVKSLGEGYGHRETPDFSKAPATGKHITITFTDGEVFYATSETIHRDRTGFFVCPINRESNTIRAFVINSSIDQIEISG